MNDLASGDIKAAGKVPRDLIAIRIPMHGIASPRLPRSFHEPACDWIMDPPSAFLRMSFLATVRMIILSTTKNPAQATKPFGSQFPGHRSGHG